MKEWIQLIVVCVILIISLSFSVFQVYTTQEKMIVTVLNTEVKRVGDTDRYLINVQKEDGSTETLQVRDEWLLGFWSSGDTYFYLKNNTGNEVTISAFGYRVPFLSWYRVIYKVE